MAFLPLLQIHHHKGHRDRRHRGYIQLAHDSSQAEAPFIYLYEALKTARIDRPYIRHGVEALIAFLEPFIEDAENLYPSSAIGLVRHSLDIDRYATDEDIPSPDDTKIANLNQLQLAAARFDSINKFLEYTESFADQAVADNQEGVSLMTVHKATKPWPDQRRYNTYPRGQSGRSR